MLNLVTGKPGHGKNIYSFTLLEKKLNIITYNKKKKIFTNTSGRPLVFIDFDGVDIDNAHSIDAIELENLPIRLNTDNESDILNNSIVVIDEAHTICPKSSNKSGFSDFVKFLKIHRHYGFDFIFITQEQKDINIDIRNLIENHYRVVRPFGFGSSTSNFYLGCVTNENPMPQKVSSVPFNLDKRYFDIYKSATVHTHKKIIPLKFYMYFILLFSLIGGLLFSYSNIDFFDNLSLQNVVPSVAQVSIPALAKVAPALKLTSKKRALPVGLERKHYLRKVNYLDLSKYDKFFDLQSINYSFVGNSFYCYCTVDNITILKSFFNSFDINKNVLFSISVFSLNDENYDTYNLALSKGLFSKLVFKDNFNIFGDDDTYKLLVNYLYTDLSATLTLSNSLIVSDKSSSLLDFSSQYNYLVDTTSNTNSGVTVSKEVKFIPIGYSIDISNIILDKNNVNFTLEQNHSVLNSILNGVPVVSNRTVKTSLTLPKGSFFQVLTYSNKFTQDKEQGIIGKIFGSNDNQAIANNYVVLMRVNF